MRIEYVVVGLILMLVIFAVVIAMLGGVVPGLSTIFDMFGRR